MGLSPALYPGELLPVSVANPELDGPMGLAWYKAASCVLQEPKP